MYLPTTTLAYHQSPNNHWHESSNNHTGVSPIPWQSLACIFQQPHWRIINPLTITGMYLPTNTLAYHQSPNNHWHESSNKHWHKSFNNHHMNSPTTTNCNIYFFLYL
jgi:hypothetical protein